MFIFIDRDIQNKGISSISKVINNWPLPQVLDEKKTKKEI